MLTVLGVKWSEMRSHNNINVRCVGHLIPAYTTYTPSQLRVVT